jgi:hypothetical protein
MNFAYITNDEVNEDLALQVADECGINVCPLSPHQNSESGWYDAVLYDWDSLSQEQRQEIPLACLAGARSSPVAVHGYGLEDDEREALHQDGIAVFRRMEPRVFKTLRRLVKREGRILQGVAAVH